LFNAGITAGSSPNFIAAGPDGNVWFTPFHGDRVGRITPDGFVTEFTAGISPGATPRGITAGPDGNVWFVESGGSRIGRITPKGVVSEFSAGITPGARPTYITAGVDGNLWFTETGIGRIGRITTAGEVTEFDVGFAATAGLSGIATGADGNLWVSENALSRMGRLGIPGITLVTVVEYHHAAFDHYFITPDADEIALLDAHAPPLQDWSRTGFSFKAYASTAAPRDAVGICRFFNDHFAGRSSHFYAAHGFGCETTLTTFPDWMLEDAALFSAILPDEAGQCPSGTIPVYRLYNNGAGGAPNHRFVTNLAERQRMIDARYTPEGAGKGVAMCVAA
jgi:hypothetical protein